MLQALAALFLAQETTRHVARSGADRAPTWVPLACWGK